MDDPARQLFPDAESVNLYEVLGLQQSDGPSTEAVRKAYRQQALRHHPDKAVLRGVAAEEAALKFHQIGFAYSILSDDQRRKRYDTTGSTSDSIFDGPIDWDEYFKTLWTGEVSAKTLAEFEAKYKGASHAVPG
jgi:hypothetical protein